MLNKKRIIYMMIILFVAFIGTSIAIKVNDYKQKTIFTQEKWIQAPNQRYLIVKDMIKRYNFSAMTKEEVIRLLGEPDNVWGAGGWPIRTFDRNIPPVDLDDPNSIYYSTHPGYMPEEISGFYLKFDESGKVVDYAIIHFTT